MAVFKKTESYRPSEPSFHSEVETSQSLIGRGMFIKGEINSDEELVVEGKLEGQLKAKNRVIIGKNGVVTADVEAKEIIIKGRINGNVKGNHKVIIEPAGILNGNIIAQRVVLAEGAVFKGNIDMSVQEERGSKEKETRKKEEGGPQAQEKKE